MKSQSDSYASAGVDITAGYKAVELMKSHIARTTTDGVIGSIGGFGGLFQPNLTGMEEPILVSGTDGVGTKLRIAFLMDKHDTVGIDCVAMCVNDIVCCGARPLFFLDYIACGKNYPDRIASIVSGVAEGCVQSGAALIGGETAEMPGFYPVDEYDLAGFAVGIVDKKKMIDNSAIQAGDVIIALPSSGVHSNGFSLVRKVFDVENSDIKTPNERLGGKSIGEALLAPTKIYVKPVLAVQEAVTIKGVSHITGGGFYENVPRSIPSGFTAKIEKASIRTPVLFDLIAEAGNIPERDMFNTFNMGVGMCMIVDRDDADTALSVLKEQGEDAYVIGEVVEGSAVMVSGGGTNLQALIDAQQSGIIRDGKISLVVSSSPTAYALTRAEQNGIEGLVCNDEEELIRIMDEHQISLIVLAGYMTILSENFVKRYPERIINVHPALIPSFCGKGFYGLRVHEAALNYGVKITGATVHYVNEIPDGGKIILQKAVEIQEDDTPKTLQKRVMEEAEWVILPQAVQLVCEKILSEENHG